MEKKNVYVSFVKIEGRPNGGDFYVTLKSEKIMDTSDVDFSKCNTKEQVLAAASKIDPDAKVIGGIILAKNEDIKIAGVYKPNNDGDIPTEEFLKYFDELIDDLKEKITKEVIKRGMRK